MGSLEVSDKMAADVAVAPRVSLADIEAAILCRYDTTAHQAMQGATRTGKGVDFQPDDSPLALLSICLLQMRNGFTLIGKSAPASPENFDAELGRKFAYEDAVRQLWPLMGFALRDRLAAA